ncbi:mitochondrial hypoxia responsive domain-containing protein [Plectosphaerella plurivora]|uniref:Mitochondrial hypoxia responsive domain-containing protein n=1 Tax=Plectosphaerella plurivora TaxID=936078 RepID=A0A9P9A3X3_9PEZI|nr:mitochondrial hypoxia responsive domain-containing protein [Plectosphaerella plurivora]
MGHAMPSSFDDNQMYNEKPLAKVFRKLREEPLVPLGCALTVIAFTSAYRATRRGDSKTANRMFRYRVAAQGFTVLAMVAGGMYYNKDREVSKELRKLKEERDAEEKRQKWIRELEIRDQEEKAMRAKIHERKAKSDAAKAAAAAAAPAEGAPVEGEAKTGGVLGALNRSNGWGKQGEAPAADGKATEVKAVAAAAEPTPVKPAEPSK